MKFIHASTKIQERPRFTALCFRSVTYTSLELFRINRLLFAQTFINLMTAQATRRVRLVNWFPVHRLIHKCGGWI